MRDWRNVGKVAVLTAAGLMSGASSALALTADGLDLQTGYSVRVQHDPAARRGFSPYTRRVELEQFQTRYGGRWEWDWDQETGTPEAVWGSGLALVSPGEARAGDVVTALRAFVNQNPEMFRVPASDLRLDYAYANGDLWYVNFRRTFQGVPVHQSNVSFRLKQGRLILFSAESYPDADVSAVPSVDANAALDVASYEVPFRAGVDQVARQPELWVYPDFRDGFPEYRLAWLLETRNTSPSGWYGYFVDAHTGDLLEVWRNDAYDFSGQINLDIEPRTVNDALSNVAAAYNGVSLSTGGAQNTDSTGHFSYAGSGAARTLTGSLRGQYVTLNNNGSQAAFSTSISDGVPLLFNWAAANSDLSERDTFADVNRTNRFVVTVFPGVAWINTAVTANVNLAQTCNAFWNGSTLNFFKAGGGCNATGRIFDVVAHEWGHGLDQNAPGGAQDGGLGEFIGDLVAMTQTRDNHMGPGFFTSGAPVRDMDDPNFRCYDPSKTEVHDAGELLGAVVYDIMNDFDRVGVVGEDFKRHMLLPIAGAQTRSQWYHEMLVADDDNANLADGTPNECLIYNQFKLHSCGSTRWPGIPAGDPPNCTAGARTVYTATDIPKTIPDNDPSGTTSSLTVTSGPVIDDLDVTLDIGHAAIGDLTLVLSHVATDTVSVVLHDRTGGQQDDITTSYDRKTPSKEPLARFNGRSAVGVWTLAVKDSAAGNVGTLRSWSIEARPRP